MYSSVRREIPEFLSDQVIYCDNLTHKRGYRTCFLLSKHLKLYEFHQKSLLNCIDLNQTILNKLPELRTYNGRKGKWFKVDNNQTISGDPEDLPVSSEEHIKFGKFYYFSLNIRKLYILIQCWDKLIVVQREDALLLTAEYEDVAHFKVVNGPIKLQAVVELNFSNGQIITTDFQESKTTQAPDNSLPQMQSQDFQQLMDRIKDSKTELEIQQRITQGQWNALSSRKVFGSVQQRSQKLEEKQKLSKFGDVWVRLPPNGGIVIGVPLVNSCVPPNTKVLRNLKPIIACKNETTHFKDIATYEHHLYNLQMKFEDLESLESFLQTEDQRFQATSWSRGEDRQLLPEGFAVLIVKLPIAQVINVTDCQLLVTFDITKTAEIDEIFKPQVLTHEEHQIFLKDLNFSDILNNRKSYVLSFDTRTLHQDFLAIAATSLEMQFSVKFLTVHDARIFESLLSNTFGLKSLGAHEAKSSNFQMDDTIELPDECYTPGESSLPHLYYNEDPTSFWYGLLVLKHTNEPAASWKFYTRGQEHAHLFLRQLFQDHLIRDCNVQSIHCSSECKDLQIKELESALRRELKCLIKMHKRPASDSYTSDMCELKKLQMHTDWLMCSAAK